MRKKSVALIIIMLLVCFTGCGTETDSKSLGSDTSHSEDNTEIVSANNKLGFKLMERLEAGEDGNVFLSPTGLFMALSMVYNGAAGETKEEIAKVLHAEGIDANELNQANASLINRLDKNMDHIQLNVANSIWLNKELHFQDNFLEQNQEYFNAKIENIDVLDSQSPKIINDWVKKSTNNKIEDIADDPLDPDLVAMLINAIYFKGDWLHPFDPNQTEDRVFHLGDGTTKHVPVMSLSAKLSYLENDHFQAVTLPYGDGEMSMKIFLPKEESSLEELQQQLTEENWDTLNKSFGEKNGTLMLPNFQLEYEATLNQTLEDLGMHTAFDKDHANFENMIEEDIPLWISKVKQKTFLDVSEEGTEAAAVTSVEVVTESTLTEPPFKMEVNRPFFIIITEDETDTILFMGSIFNP